MVNSTQMMKFLPGSLSGLHVGTYRQGNDRVDILMRRAEDERMHRNCPRGGPVRDLRP